MVAGEAAEVIGLQRRGERQVWLAQFTSSTPLPTPGMLHSTPGVQRARISSGARILKAVDRQLALGRVPEAVKSCLEEVDADEA